MSFSVVNFRNAKLFDPVNRPLQRNGRASGGGPAPSAPVIVTPGSIDEQPLVGQPILLTEPDVTGADSVAYQWYSDPGTWAAPISGWTDATETPTATEYAFNGPVGRRATYSNAAGDTVEDLEAPDVVGAVYSDDWSGYTVGDDLTDLEVLYDRLTGSGLAVLVETSAVAPAGKALTLTATAANLRGLWSTAAQVFGTAQAANTDRVQALFVFTHVGDTATSRYHLRFIGPDLTSLNPGLLVFSGVARLQIDTENTNTAVGTDMGTLVAGTTYCLRIEITGNQIRGKLWEYGDPEPTSFISRTNSTTFNPPAPYFGVRHTASGPEDLYTVLWWSGSYNTDAPFWPGFVEPPPSFSDLMTFAAASSVTEVSFADGAMVIALEDV